MPDQEQPFSSDLGWLLSRAAHAFITELTAALEDVGLSPRFNCVLHAAKSGERTQTELAQMAGLDKTTMVVTLDEMEAQGLASACIRSSGPRPATLAFGIGVGLVALASRSRSSPRAGLPSGPSPSRSRTSARSAPRSTKPPRRSPGARRHEPPGALSPWQTSPG